MGHAVRIVVVAATGLLLTGCLSSDPKIAEVEQVSAEQRAAMQATEDTAEGTDGGDGDGAGGPPQFVAVDIEFSQAPDEVQAGTVAMTLVNDGDIEHDVTIEELGDQTVLDAAGGETDEAEVELEAGEYTYYCSVPGHRGTMEGTLTVTE